MPKIDESVINFAVYEDGVEYMGTARAILPNLTALTQTISGAGIAGNIEVPIQGHFDTMSLKLEFRTITEDAIKLSEPREHNIDLRVAQQIHDVATGTKKIQSIKHLLVIRPKVETAGNIAPASPADASGEYPVRYWATYIDGVKQREVDPINFIYEVNGVDYLADVRAALGK